MQLNDTKTSNLSGEDVETRPLAQQHLLLRTVPALSLLVVISLAFNWPYLTGGFLGEDYIFLNLLRQDPLPYSRWLGLWSVADLPSLTSIWWFEGQGVSAFWRPLPSLLFEASVRVFGEHAFPLHLFSILVHGLVGGTLFILVRTVTGRPILALIAGLLFLSCEDHSMSVGWISTMTDLVCVLFVNIGLITYALWLQKRKPWLLAASLAAVVLAMLSKESAVVAPLAIVFMTMLMPRGCDSQLPTLGMSSLKTRGAGFLRDWLSWFPAVLLLVAYLSVYRLIGFGGLGGGMYIDPISHPGRYATHLIEHLPVMWLATLSPVPPSLAMFMPEAIAPLAGVGAIAFIGFVAGLWPMRGRALVVWAMTLYIVALLPQMSTDASERCLYLPAIGSSVLLALLILQIGPLARRVSPAASRSPLVTRLIGWASLGFILAPGIVLSATMPFMYLPSFERPGNDAASIVPYVQERDPSHVLVLNTPGFFHTFYIGPVVEFRVPRSIDIRVLSSMNGVMTVERINDRSFILHADRKGWLTNVFAGMLRSSRPPRPGRVYEKVLFTATLDKMTRDGRDVLAVRFEMSEALDDPRILFLQWDGETFLPINLAALPVGEIVRLADTSDVWSSMW